LFRKSIKMDASSPCFSSHPAVETSSSVSCGIRIWSSLFGNSRLAFSPTRRGCVRSLPGMTQVGTVIEARASALAPMTGRPAARGTAADVGGQGLELGEQGVEVIGPDFILGFVAFDDDIRGAAVAAIMEQHTVTGCRHLRGEWHDTAQVAAATWGERHPRAM